MSAILPDAFMPVARVNPVRRLAQWIVCGAVGLHMTLVLAQPRAATPDVMHTMQAGETLYGLSEHYTGQHNHWPQLQRYNKIADPYRIPTGLQVRIPVGLLTPAPAFATAAYVTGDVRYARPGEKRTHPLKAGVRLFQGTRIEVGVNGFLRLELVDGSVARIPAGSAIRLAGVRHQSATKTTVTLIQLEVGRVDSTVRPLRNKSSHFEIDTPLAVASVRGTEFGVAIQPDATVTSEVTRGTVVLLGERHGQDRLGNWSRRLHANQGARVDRNGAVGSVRTLPGAPDLSALPDIVTDANFVHLPLPVMPGVVAYRVQISSDPAFERVVRDKTVRGSQVQFAELEDGNYMVGVRAEDDVGLLGAMSKHALRVKARPVAPLLQRPAPDEEIVGDTIEFTCTQPMGIRRFRLQIAKDKTFQTPVTDASILSECRYQATLPPGHYFWRVASVQLGADGTPNQGPFSASGRFELVAPPPVPPALAVSEDDEGLMIHWGGAPGYRYRVQVARGSGFASLVHDETRTQPFLYLPGLASGTYYVRIQAIDTQGQAGAFSPTQTAHIGATIRDSSGSVVRDADGNAVGRE